MGWGWVRHRCVPAHKLQHAGARLWEFGRCASWVQRLVLRSRHASPSVPGLHSAAHRGWMHQCRPSPAFLLQPGLACPGNPAPSRLRNVNDMLPGRGAAHHILLELRGQRLGRSLHRQQRHLGSRQATECYSLGRATSRRPAQAGCGRRSDRLCQAKNLERCNGEVTAAITGTRHENVKPLFVPAQQSSGHSSSQACWCCHPGAPP